MPVQKGNVLLIASDLDNTHRVTVKWQQMLSDKTAAYYTVVAKNKSQGNSDVVFFIEAEWYEGSGGSGQHISHVAQKNADGFYELIIDDKCQYGQKNKQGDMRFVVYHDKSRKPYQHRFIETSIGSLAANVSAKIAGAFGYGSIADAAKTISSNYVGDYLNTF